MQEVIELMVDQLLGGLFGGQEADDTNTRQQRAKDFVGRFEKGRLDEGYTDDEAVHNYRKVADTLSPQEYEDAAADTFQKMSREERREYRRMMRDRSGGKFDGESDDTRELAKRTARFRQEEGGDQDGLASLFGFGDDKNAASGDMVSKARGSGDGGSLLDNPLAKVALGGIAAMAMKKIMDR